METALEYVLMNSYKEGMIAHVGKNQHEFDELIALALADKQSYSWRAAGLLWTCMMQNDKRLQKYIGEIITRINTAKDGHQRNLINILQKLKIGEEYEGLLFDTCVQIWCKIDKQPSVRYKAFEFMVEMCKKYPELYNEVIILAQDEYVDSLSGGIKSSMYRMIKSLNRV